MAGRARPSLRGITIGSDGSFSIGSGGSVTTLGSSSSSSAGVSGFGGGGGAASASNRLRGRRRRRGRWRRCSGGFNLRRRRCWRRHLGFELLRRRRRRRRRWRRRFGFELLRGRRCRRCRFDFELLLRCRRRRRRRRPQIRDRRRDRRNLRRRDRRHHELRRRLERRRRGRAPRASGHHRQHRRDRIAQLRDLADRDGLRERVRDIDAPPGRRRGRPRLRRHVGRARRYGRRDRLERDARALELAEQRLARVVGLDEPDRHAHPAVQRRRLRRRCHNLGIAFEHHAAVAQRDRDATALARRQRRSVRHEQPGAVRVAAKGRDELFRRCTCRDQVERRPRRHLPPV